MKTLNKIFIGIILGLVLVMISCTALSSVDKNQAKIADYYELCNFDFIIPKPWYSQIPELKNKSYIYEVIPYYTTEKTVSSDTNTANIDLYLLDENSSIENTCFSKSLSVQGESNLLKDGILLDERSAKALDATVGQKVKIGIGNKTIVLTINGIVLSNKFNNLPSAILYYSGDIKTEIESNITNLSYTGAFIKVNDIATAETYFTEQYRALGRIGDRSWYKDSTSYEYMRKSIENLNVAKEIINISQLRANSASNSSDKKKSNINSTFICCLISGLMFIILWTILLIISSNKFRERIKHGTKVNKIVFEFFIGELTSLLVFIAGIYFILGNENISIILPVIIVMIFCFAITFIFSNNSIKRKRKLA